MKRLAKAVYIRLRGSVIRHEGHAIFRTHCPREDDSAPPPHGEFRAEMAGDVQMRHCTEPQSRLKQLLIALQQLPRTCGAAIGDDTPAVDLALTPRSPRHDSLL